MARASDPPVLLVKWYDFAKWLLERVESFPKSQRFVFGQRLADRSLAILETLVDAAWSPPGPLEAGLLARANRELEVLRWLLRMAEARRLLTARHYRFACVGLGSAGACWAAGSARRAGGRSTASARSSASSPRGPADADDTASFELHSTLTPVLREALERFGLTRRVSPESNRRFCAKASDLDRLPRVCRGASD